ncbi:hypothetical protein MTO96_005980 [Rhipicephalus appendiculatus]
MRQAWHLYARLVRDHPMKTQLVTTATVMLSGDLIAQKVIERRPDIDVPRAARFFIMGVGFVGPVVRGCFMVVLGTLQRRSWDDIKQSLRANYLQILQTMYMIWPVAQFVNFRFVPFSYRQVFGSCVAIVWNTYLASKANRTQKARHGEVVPSKFRDLKTLVPSTDG